MAKRATKAKTAEAAPVKPIPPVEEWPAAHVERWPIGRIKQNPLNPRTHPERQLKLLDALFREYGQTRPVLVAAEDEMLIAGHGFHLAATRAGAGELAVAIASGWPAEKKTAYTIADNQAGLLSGWNEERLGLQLADLSKLKTIDVMQLGFTKPTLARLMPAEIREGMTDPDTASPCGPPPPISLTGDLWLLGKHRLLCGDATNADHVAHALGELRPRLMVTDPPYGVEYDPDWRNRALGVGSDRALGEVVGDDIPDWRTAWALFEGDVAYVWHAGVFAARVQQSLEVCDFEIRAQIIWAKSRHVISRGDYHWQHEPCWYAVRRGGKGHWAGDRSQTTLWPVAHLKSDSGHGTQKPVECMARPMINNSRPGDAVYEPFAGSGTTIIAAEQTGRVCAAIEIDPAYVDVAVARWEAFTGLGAILAATGQDRAAVSAARRAAAKKEAA